MVHISPLITCYLLMTIFIHLFKNVMYANKIKINLFLFLLLIVDHIRYKLDIKMCRRVTVLTSFSNKKPNKNPAVKKIPSS